MNTKNHRSVLVPIEAWMFGSPLLRRQGQVADLGLLADALVYYDHVYINLNTERELVALLQWFSETGQLRTLERLMSEGAVSFYNYGFISAPIYDPGRDEYVLMNMQGPDFASSITQFERIVLGNKEVRDIFGHSRHAARFHKIALTGLIESKAVDFGPAVEEARSDSITPALNQEVIQALVDEVYQPLGLGKAPEIEVTVDATSEGKHHIHYNINLEQMASTLGSNFPPNPASPLVALMHANRLLVSSARLKCDLVLPNPLAAIVSHKLGQGISHTRRTQAIVSDLIVEVDFPNIRRLVNVGSLNAETVMTLRDKGATFRTWLHTEAEIDRNAIISYHREFAKRAGFTDRERRYIHLFGVVAGATAGSGIGAVMGGQTGGMIGSVVGGASQFLLALAADLNSGWKPVVFGDWARKVAQEAQDRIE